MSSVLFESFMSLLHVFFVCQTENIHSMASRVSSMFVLFIFILFMCNELEKKVECVSHDKTQEALTLSKKYTFKYKMSP